MPALFNVRCNYMLHGLTGGQMKTIITGQTGDMLGTFKLADCSDKKNNWTWYI